MDMDVHQVKTKHNKKERSKKEKGKNYNLPVQLQSTRNFIF